jgi:hypothetical protein
MELNFLSPIHFDGVHSDKGTFTLQEMKKNDKVLRELLSVLSAIPFVGAGCGSTPEYSLL